MIDVSARAPWRALALDCLACGLASRVCGPHAASQTAVPVIDGPGIVSDLVFAAFVVAWLTIGVALAASV